MADLVRCRLCGAVTESFATARIRGRHDVTYFRCPECEYIQTEQPYWLEEAYKVPITPSDLGLASRSLRMARVTAAVLSIFFNPGGAFVDFGGGYGLFVRLMRDAGYDFRLIDPYCKNLFATGFLADQSARYELLTAFEVLEHVPEPMAGFREMTALSENILFSTVLMPEPPPLPDQWWYYGLEHGQHVGFFTERSLRMVASTFGLHYVHDGRELHLLSRKRVSKTLFRLLCRYRAAALFSSLMRRSTLLTSDAEAALALQQEDGQKPPLSALRSAPK